MTVCCPYCYSQNTVAIVCTDKISPKKSKYYSSMCNQNRLKRNEAILSNVNFHYSKEYNGKIIERRTYDRYCQNCGKVFYYISNMLISDIVELVFIIDTNDDRWKYDIFFDKNQYNVDHNYFIKEFLASLTPARKIKLLKGIEESNILKSKVQDSKSVIDYKLKWSIYIYFYDGQSFYRGGYDKYPNNLELFLNSFLKVFKNNIFKRK